MNQTLVKIITENPNLPIRVFYPGDSYGDYAYLLGEINHVCVDEMLVIGEEIIRRSDDDYVEWIERGNYDYELIGITDEMGCKETYEKAKEFLDKKLEWEKVILITVCEA